MSHWSTFFSDSCHYIAESCHAQLFFCENDKQLNKILEVLTLMWIIPCYALIDQSECSISGHLITYTLPWEVYKIINSFEAMISKIIVINLVEIATLCLNQYSVYFKQKKISKEIRLTDISQYQYRSFLLSIRKCLHPCLSLISLLVFYIK